MNMELLDRARSRAWASFWVDDLVALVESVSHIPGDIMECGSYRGGTAMAMAAADPTKTVWAFDTFSGMPQVSEHDQHKPGDFGDANWEEIKAATRDVPNLRLVKGEFAHTFPAWSRGVCHPLSALFLDCDLYESYKLALSYFWSLLSPGGICVLEDYGVLDCQGATKAIEEFFSPNQIILREGLYVVTKP